MPALNMRLATPRAVIDINRLPGLDAIRADARGPRDRRARAARGGGALPARPRARAADGGGDAPRGHEAIRARGTVGGSLALADPAAELPACAVALDATIRVEGRRGRRGLAAEDFFRGIYTPRRAGRDRHRDRGAAGRRRLALGLRGAGAAARRLRPGGPGRGARRWAAMSSEAQSLKRGSYSSVSARARAARAPRPRWPGGARMPRRSPPPARARERPRSAR